VNISPAESIRLSLAAVWTHRFRSFLTILGIVIGITTVVVVASLLSGVRSGIVAFFEELGRTTSSSPRPWALPAWAE
jgi:putative ABC transport system permease protein